VAQASAYTGAHASMASTWGASIAASGSVPIVSPDSRLAPGSVNASRKFMAVSCLSDALFSVIKSSTRMPA
jgi:hypothetical protein